MKEILKSCPVTPLTCPKRKNDKKTEFTPQIAGLHSGVTSKRQQLMCGEGMPVQLSIHQHAAEPDPSPTNNAAHFC